MTELDHVDRRFHIYYPSHYPSRFTVVSAAANGSQNAFPGYRYQVHCNRAHRSHLYKISALLGMLAELRHFEANQPHSRFLLSGFDKHRPVTVKRIIIQSFTIAQALSRQRARPPAQERR